MKKAEIEVGAELFKASASGNWMTDRYTHRRAVVLSDGFYRRTGGNWSHKHLSDPKGTKVHVRLFLTNAGPDDKGYEDYVSLAQLRGPYAEIAPLVEAAITAKDAADAAKHKAVLVAEQRVMDAIAALAAAGIKATRGGYGHGTVLQLDPLSATALVVLLAPEGGR